MSRQAATVALAPAGVGRSAGPRPARLIVHVIDELRVGGAQTHLVTMLREAIARYPHVRHRAVSLFGDGPIGDRLRELGVPVDVLDVRDDFGRRRFFAVARALADLFRAQRPDVVEAHLTWSRLLGLYAAWRAGVPRRIGFEQGDIYLDSWKFRLANRIGQHFAHRVVACSRALAAWDRRVLGIASRRLVVLHNCVDPSRFRPRADRAGAAAFGLPAGTTAFAAVGTLGRGVDKRTDVLIRAIAVARDRGADVGLLVCGDGECRDELGALADRLGVDGYVKFLGTRGDVPDVLAACDGFCHAAPFEPFGIACIEAMAAGLPVVVPDSGGICEAVDPGVDGLVYPPLDHEALANALGRLHAQSGLRRRMGRSARRTVEERFSVRGYVRTLYAMYGLVDCAGAEVGR